MDLVAKSDILNKPITPRKSRSGGLRSQKEGDASDSSEVCRTAAAMQEERTIAANFVDHFQKKDREVESLEKVRQLEKHWEAKREAGYRIEDYYNAVTFAGGTPNIACRMLQLYLIGPARVWLGDLEENTIFCWLDLKKAFENHFRGTYKRPATTSDLQACIQKKGETSRSFLTRWLATRNECENVDNRTAMHTFIGGLQRGGLLRHKLTCLVNANKLTLDEMINIASDHTAADDDAVEISRPTIPCEQKKNRDNGVKKQQAEEPPEDQKGGGSDMVAMTFQRGGPGGGRGRGREAEQGGAGTRSPQPIRAPKRTRNTGICRAWPIWIRLRANPPIPIAMQVGQRSQERPGGRIQASPEAPPRGKGGKGKNKDKEEDSSEAMDEDDASPNPRRVPQLTSPTPLVRRGLDHLGTPTVREKSAPDLERHSFRLFQSEPTWTPNRKALVEFLRANMDIFAWQPSDMSGVPRELAEHYLNINPVPHTNVRCGGEGPNWRNVHAYVDDIAVMTRKGSDLL
ncbi:hypothetical protein QYE76_028859 [Lolium multiflorum]|uniref:Retrotransposon gag domain-containing protein n=1 Tax=Lolium multiflorum TaxID=4521 RepID=A0AAD8QN41_LOLMU|nr:hypothetical protein QYE76_028859 [Lolium multiflorum]